jgi:predicted anti-sigma-YlaC factor YlaD
MDCARCQELISDRLDGRTTETEERLLDVHIVGCRSCEQVEAGVRVLHRSVRLRTAEVVPDLTDEILARANPPIAGRLLGMRVGLAWVALVGLVSAVPDLLLGTHPGASVHVSRHLGAMSVGLFVGFLYAAWRPARAYGVLPVAVGVAAAVALGAIIDLATGAASGPKELSTYAVDIAGFVLLWMLGGSPRPRLPRARDLRPGTGPA